MKRNWGEQKCRILLDPEHQKKAAQYARRSRILFSIDLLVVAAAFAALVVSSVPRAAGNILAPRFSAPVAAVIFFLVVAVGHSLITMPVSYCRTFVLPGHSRISRRKVGDWLAGRVKHGVLFLIPGSVVVAFVYWALWKFPSVWWLLGGMLVLTVTAMLNLVGPILVTRLFFKCEPLRDKDMRDRVQKLAERAGAHIQGVFTASHRGRGNAANAMFMGLGKSRRVIISDRLLEGYTPEEIEVILAHELGHHVQHDVFRMMIVQSALGLAGLYAVDLVLRAFSGPFGLQGVWDVSGLPLLLGTLGAFILVAGPLTNAYTRHIEKVADGWALRLTDNPECFVNVMAKLANQNLSEVDPGWWVEALFYDHPPYRKRLDFGRQYVIRKQRSEAGY
ncbi:MAG: M48 family metalloprotease [Chloroflexi bacterium]|nr:M48 family metalloprotease [Chloroflexota bacterium]